MVIKLLVLVKHEWSEINGWQLAKMKKSIPDMSLPKFVKIGNLGQYRENLIFCQ